jgi:hypothetical protein
MGKLLIGTAVVGMGLVFAGLEGARLGNLVVLGLAVAIFVGTLTLGRKKDADRSANGTASSTTSRG